MINLTNQYPPVTINYIVKLLNRVIRDAIAHGGDLGGPYYCYPIKLVDSVASLLNQLGITDYTAIIDSSHNVVIVPKTVFDYENIYD